MVPPARSGHPVLDFSEAPRAPFGLRWRDGEPLAFSCNWEILVRRTHGEASRPADLGYKTLPDHPAAGQGPADDRYKVVRLRGSTSRSRRFGATGTSRRPVSPALEIKTSAHIRAEVVPVLSRSARRCLV